MTSTPLYLIGYIFETACRHYGQTTDTAPVVPIEFESNPYQSAEDIFGFVLAEKMAVKEDTLFGRYTDLVQHYGFTSPNIVVFLDGNLFNVFDMKNGAGNPVLSIKKGNHVGRTCALSPFSNLLRWIYIAYHEVKTSEIVVFGKYFSEGNGDGKTVLIESVPLRTVK